MADPLAQLQALDERTLTSLMRRALNNPTIQLEEWSFTKIHADYNPLTVGVYRIAGTARADEHIRSWSVVLKMVHALDEIEPFESDWLNDPTNFAYWQREALVFQSGLFNGWQGNLVPVQCYGVLKPAADLRWLWLEDVQESRPGPWPLERHILAARHFGEFNGAFIDRYPLPDYPWLTHHFLRQWLAFCRALGSDAILRDLSVWAAPLVHGVLPPDLAPRILQVLEDAEDLLAALERLPQTLCHLDTDRRNLFTRTDPRGQEQTVVIDWGQMGMAAFGEDLGNQVGGDLFHLAVPAREAAQYAEAAFAAYVEGLQAMGWCGQPEQVRFASLAHQLHYLSFIPIVVQEYVHTVQLPPWMRTWVSQHAVTPTEAIRAWGEALMFLLKQAEEARQFVDG
jgi:hypothetical protein